MLTIGSTSSSSTDTDVISDTRNYIPAKDLNHMSPQFDLRGTYSVSGLTLLALRSKVARIEIELSEIVLLIKTIEEINNINNKDLSSPKEEDLSSPKEEDLSSPKPEDLLDFLDLDFLEDNVLPKKPVSPKKPAPKKEKPTKSLSNDFNIDNDLDFLDLDFLEDNVSPKLEDKDMEKESKLKEILPRITYSRLYHRPEFFYKEQENINFIVRGWVRVIQSDMRYTIPERRIIVDSLLDYLQSSPAHYRRVLSAVLDSTATPTDIISRIVFKVHALPSDKGFADKINKKMKKQLETRLDKYPDGNLNLYYVDN